MKHMKRPDLAPGDYQYPVMRHARISSSEDPNFIRLWFQAETQHQGQMEQLTIAIPISVLDAAGMLRSLRMLQAQGTIPSVAEPSSPTKPN